MTAAVKLSSALWLRTRGVIVGSADERDIARLEAAV
jgi:hypothetical protein